MRLIRGVRWLLKSLLLYMASLRSWDECIEASLLSKGHKPLFPTNLPALTK